MNYDYEAYKEYVKKMSNSELDAELRIVIAQIAKGFDVGLLLAGLHGEYVSRGAEDRFIGIYKEMTEAKR